MTIYIPTDLSKASIETISGLAPLLHNRDAEITLFHCVEPTSTGSTMMININDLLVSEAKGKLEKIAAKLANQFGANIVIHCEVMAGYFYQQFKMLIDEQAPDLVLIPSKSKTGIQKIMSSQQSLRFIGEVAPPVLVFPFSEHLINIEKIGIAIDQKEGVNNDVLKDIKTLSEFFNAEFIPFHVDDFSEEDLSYYNKSELKKALSSEVHIIHDAQIERGIERWYNKENIDVMCLITHNKNLLQKTFGKSITRNLIKHNQLPTLILNRAF